MSQTFDTSDLGLASALSCLGYKTIGIERHDPRRVVFCFAQDQGINDAIQGYWNGSLRLPPQALFLHQKSLKQRIYDQAHD